MSMPSAAMPGSAAFLKYCGVLSEHLAHNAEEILSGPRGAPDTKPRRLFERTFEAIIEASRHSRHSKLWDTFDDVFAAASAEIQFCTPIANASIDDRHSMFFSCARCFACAVMHSRALPPNEQILKTEFNRWLIAWRSKTVDYMLIARVTGIHPGELDPVCLSDDFVLTWDSHLSELTKDELAKHEGNPFDCPSPFVLLSKRRVDKAVDPGKLVAEFRTDLMRCVTALRLATGGLIGCEAIHVMPDDAYVDTFDRLFRCVAQTSEISIHGDNDQLGKAISKVEAVEVLRLSVLLKSVGHHVSVATERFNSAIGRSTDDEEVIDLAIALESLLGRGGKDQARYRFALFGAIVLADSGIADLFELFQCLYDARSAVVHGGKRMAEVITEPKIKSRFNGCTREFFKQCRNVTRRTIIEFLQEAPRRSPSAFLKALENVIMKNAKSWLRRNDEGAA